MKRTPSPIIAGLSGLMTTAVLLIPSLVSAAELEDTELELEEVVVVAQKREQNLQDVAVSVSAFSGEDIKALGVERALDLVNHVPNLEVLTIFGDAQQPSLHIRGVGLASFTDSFEPPISMYVDEVYKGAGVGQTIQLFDLERVEVLRGPQGTLFGRNSTGGLLNLITRKPTEDFSMEASVSYGSDSETAFEGVVSGPLSDSVRGRLALRDMTHDGWSEGNFDGEDYADADTFGVRGMLEFDIGEKGSLLLRANHSSAEGNTSAIGVSGSLDPATNELCSLSQLKTGGCYSPSGIAFDGNPFTGNSLGGFDPEHVPGQTAASYGVDPRQEVDVTGYAASLDWDFDSWQLTAIGAIEDTEKYYFEDLVIFSDGFTLDATQKTFELRGSGETKSGDWLVGLYYFDDEKDMGSFDPTPGFGFSTRGIQDTTSWALFGQTSFALSDSLSLTLGARYTEEEKEIDYTNDLGLDTMRDWDTDGVTGRVGLDWKLAEDTLLFLTYSTGFKSGGFNGQFVFSEASLDPVEDETIETVELGIKTDFWERRARLNATVFATRYDDIQLTTLAATPGGGVATRLRNAGAADMAGLEAELSLLPIENLQISASFSYIDTELVDDETVVSGGYTTLIKGNELPMTPSTSYSLLARYSIPTAELGKFVLQANYSWKDDHWFSVENLETEREEGYGLLSARVSWLSEDEKYRVEVFGDNLTDEEYFLYLANLSTSAVVSTWSRPRTYGIKFTYQYR